MIVRALVNHGLITFVVLQAACAAETVPSASSLDSSAQSSSIASPNSIQLKLVEETTTRILNETTTGRLVGVTTTRWPNQEGLHVCGHLTTQSLTADTRFYVELRNKDGVWVAHRGQVATDDAALAKVRFVCRHNDKN